MTLRRAAHASPVAIALLVAANLVPLVGVVFLGWNLQTIVTLYWMENGVVGAYAAARIATAQGVDPNPGTVTINGRAVPRAQLANPATARVVLVPFFLVHYGGFWLVHGLFVVVFLPLMWSDIAGVPLAGIEWSALLVAIPILVLSHGASFLFNWWLGGERQASTPMREMGAPYGRVVILHLTILLGAFAVAFLGAPIGALVVLVVLKTVADLAAHLGERRNAESRAEAGGMTLSIPGRSITVGAPPPPPPQPPPPPRP
jgi:hypothetical protein